MYYDKEELSSSSHNKYAQPNNQIIYKEEISFPPLCYEACLLPKEMKSPKDCICTEQIIKI